MQASVQSTRGEPKGLAMFRKVGCHSGILLLPAGGRDGSQGHASHPQQVERQSPEQVPKPAWCMTMAWMPHRPRLKQWFTFCAITAPLSKAGYLGPSYGLCPGPPLWATSCSLPCHLTFLWKPTLLCPFAAPICARPEKQMVQVFTCTLSRRCGFTGLGSEPLKCFFMHSRRQTWRQTCTTGPRPACWPQ